MNTESGKTLHPCHQPSRYKMALLTFVGLLAPVYFVPPAMSTIVSGPRFFTVGLTVAVIVVLMAYAIMPLLKFIAAGWLRSGR